jgi:hypothetical protein
VGAKHTPGPWIIRKEWPYQVTTPVGPFYIANLNDDLARYEPSMKEEVLANARLIASAPSLLAASSKALQVLAADEQANGYAYEAAEELRAAIREATGGGS